MHRVCEDDAYIFHGRSLLEMTQKSFPSPRMHYARLCHLGCLPQYGFYTRVDVVNQAKLPVNIGTGICIDHEHKLEQVRIL